MTLIRCEGFRSRFICDLFLCSWMSSCFSTICCWNGCPCSMELLLDLCQNSVGSDCVGLLLNSVLIHWPVCLSPSDIILWRARPASIFFVLSSFSSSSGTPMTQMLGPSVLLHKSPRRYSLFKKPFFFLSVVQIRSFLLICLHVHCLFPLSYSSYCCAFLVA